MFQAALQMPLSGGEGLHGNHPAYDDFILHRLEDFARTNAKFNSSQANTFLQKNLIPELKMYINNASNSELNLNEHFKTINKIEGIIGY